MATLARLLDQLPQILSVLVARYSEELSLADVAKETAVPVTARLRDEFGKRFVSGLVLHTGTTAGPPGDRIAALPMDVLWPP